MVNYSRSSQKTVRAEPARAGIGIDLAITRLSNDDIGEFSQRNATFYQVIGISDVSIVLFDVYYADLIRSV